MQTEQVHKVQIKAKNKRPKLPKITSAKQTLPSQFHALRYQSSVTLCPTDDRNNRRYIQTDVQFAIDVNAIAECSRHSLHILEQKKHSEHQLDEQQCDQLHYRAKLHKNANIINTNSELKYEKTSEGERCNCGCKRSAGHLLDLSTQTDELRTLGPGIILFFLFQKGMVVNLVVAAVILGVFSTYSNLSAGNNPSQRDNCLDSKCIFLNNSSAQNNSNLRLVQIQYILGVIFCVFWTFVVRFVRLYGRKLNKAVDSHLQTGADFAVQLSNLPFSEYNQKDLVEYLFQFWQKVSPDKPLNVRSIQIIYNLESTRKLIDKIQEGSRKIVSLLKKQEKEYTISGHSYQQYKNLKSAVIQTYQLLNDLRKKFLNDSQFRKKLATSCCLIQFQSQQAKNSLLQKYGQNKIGLLKQIQEKLTGLCFPNTNNITFRGKVIDIHRAPQPSDLIWLNCERRISIFKLILIYVITCLIVAVSFCCLLGLYVISQYFKSQNTQNAALMVNIISIATALSLQIVNKILWIVLEFILDMEYNYSLTLKIVSLMNKALFATCFNVLALPMIVFVTMRHRLFGQDGLVGFIFNYHITTLTAGLILRLINPVDQIKRLVISLRPIRNWFLRTVRKSYSQNENANFQNYILKFYEGEYFQVAEAYIFILTNIFHACFFCHLSPPLLFFSLAEVFVYFWINKYKLLRLIKIPELTQILVFETAVTHTDLAPIIYGCGSLLVAYYQHFLHNSDVYEVKFPLIAIGIGVLAFSNPGDILNRSVSPFVDYFYAINEAKKKLDDEQSSANTIKKQGDGEQQMKNEKISRKQTYFKGSNSLKLLGFQKVLKGQDQNMLSQQLQCFCQSFLRKKDHNEDPFLSSQ